MIQKPKRALVSHRLCAILAGCITPSHMPQLGRLPASLGEGLTYNEIKTTTPVPQVTHYLTFDLAAGHLALRVTPGDTSGGKEYLSLNTSSYVKRSGALAGINAGYFGPVANSEGVAMDAVGFSLSGGVVTSPPLAPEVNSAVIKAVVCFKAKAVLIDDASACPSDYRDGLAAGPRLLRDGRVVLDGTNTTRHPRSALGVSQDGTRVWLVTTDGRQSGYSQGASLAEMAAIMKSLGAYQAINLDGGGSTTLAYRHPNNGVVVLNSPIHNGSPGRERPVATHIGVFVVDQR